MSTTIIDSAIFNKPIINIAFDLPNNVIEAISVKRFFKRSDYKFVENIGAVDKANSLDDLAKLINMYLDDSTINDEQRSRLVHEDIGSPDIYKNDLFSLRILDKLSTQ